MCDAAVDEQGQYGDRAGHTVTIMDRYIVGTGPSELHAQINLDRKISGLSYRSVRVLETSEVSGHWSVLAEVQDEIVGEGW